jgi:3-oxoacyl-[acyl-carrier protein] reductase
MRTDRVVVITGAAGGVGSLLVERFLANGDTVVATDAAAEELKRLADRNERDSRLLTHLADIASEEDVQGLADLAGQEFGRVDVLVNCAGYFPYVPFEELTAGMWRRVVDVNLTGSYLTAQAFLPLMKNRGWGRIVNFGSASVYAGAPSQAPYVAAKAGIVGFSRTLARELGGYGITVNVITPGLTVTPVVRATAPPEVLEALRYRRAIQRDEQPQDLVGPVFFLASPDSDFITGQTLNVDGGNYMV